MVGSEIKDIKDGSSFTLPSNARTIMIEIALDGATNVQLQTSHEGSSWHNVGSAITSDGLTSFDDSSENFLQKVRVVVTGTMGGSGKANLYFGRSK